MESEIIKHIKTESQKGDFDKAGLLKSYPEPVQRYFHYHLPEGIPDRCYMEIHIRGLIKLVSWANFRSVLFVNPFQGFCWKARVWMGVLPINGYDYFYDKQGAMNWTTLKFIPVMKADGPDVTRSAEGRALIESSYASFLLIHPLVTWNVISENEITATWKINTEKTPVHFIIEQDGSLKQAFMQRWGNLGGAKTFEYHTFGVNVELEASYNGVVIPVKGNAGWWFGTEKYKDGEFFRFEVKR